MTVSAQRAAHEMQAALQQSTDRITQLQQAEETLRAQAREDTDVSGVWWQCVCCGCGSGVSVAVCGADRSDRIVFDVAMPRCTEQKQARHFERALTELTEDRNRLAARNEVRFARAARAVAPMTSLATRAMLMRCPCPGMCPGCLPHCVSVHQELSAQLTVVSSQREELSVYRQDLDNKLQCVTTHHVGAT